MIKEYNITSTRTKIYQKLDKYADYFFISPELNIKSFEVLSDQVSDHSSLLLELQ